MILEWKNSRYEHPGTIITAENVQQYEHAEAEFGIFMLNAACNQRRYKNGDREYMVYLFVPGVSSSEWITLVRVRGHLLDAIQAAEDKLFRWSNRKYRLPAEFATIVETMDAKGGTP